MAATNPSPESSADPSRCAERAVELFRSRYGREPGRLAFAPGRVNLIGDHTDYAGGLVLPAALTQGCVCAIGERSGVFEAVSADVDGVASVEASGVLEAADLAGQPSWFRYAAGTFQTMREACGSDSTGASIAVASAVPSGSGLSSSAALEVSIATALEALWGVSLSAHEKAVACQKAEHRFTGTPCGLMDQLISVTGRRGFAVRIDFADDSLEYVAMPDAGEAVFVLFDSAVKHANDDGGYAARRAACESVLPKLGIATLREVDAEGLDDLPATLTDVERDAVRHVVTENRRVELFAADLAAGRLSSAGAHMNDSHWSLSRTYRVSCPQVDTLVEIASGTEGVLGARMTGGGFGGWTVALMRAADAERVGREVLERYEAQTGLKSSCRVVATGDGARLVSDAAPVAEVVSPAVRAGSPRGV